MSPRARPGNAPRLRPLGTPCVARVTVSAKGDPTTVVVGRRPRRVSAVRERWRIDDEWWRQPLARDYASVVLEDGRPLTLYHDLVEGGWWVQGEEG